MNPVNPRLLKSYQYSVTFHTNKISSNAEWLTHSILKGHHFWASCGVKDTNTGDKLNITNLDPNVTSKSNSTSNTNAMVDCGWWTALESWYSIASVHTVQNSQVGDTIQIFKYKFKDKCKIVVLTFIQDETKDIH